MKIKRAAAVKGDKDLVLSSLAQFIVGCHRRSFFLFGGRFQQHLEGARLTILSSGNNKIALLCFPFSLLFQIFLLCSQWSYLIGLTGCPALEVMDSFKKIKKGNRAGWQTNFPIHSKTSHRFFPKEEGKNQKSLWDEIGYLTHLLNIVSTAFRPDHRGLHTQIVL